MSEHTETLDNTSVCLSCDGRGWKFVRSRTAVVIRAVDESAASPAWRFCRDCRGHGVEL